MADCKKILLIDDDELFSESNKELLEAFDYDVLTARNGTEGMEIALKHRPDLIILDVMMTYDTEGFDVARKIHSTPQLANCRVILVSGIVAEKKIASMPGPDNVWLPVNRILEKPIDPRALLKEIERVFEITEK
jgi:CheY-like chemotaxis protein